MNSHFENNDKSRYDLKQERTENQFYKKIEQEILNSDYCLNDKARVLINQYAFGMNQNETEATLSFLEHFNDEQGALPDELGEEYVRLFFSADNIQRRMETGLDFHQAVAALAVAAKEKQVILDERLINKAVKIAADALEAVEAETEGKAAV
ncbi:TPA: hypothetical protein DCZ15_03315 [Candidatus Falkowbacteria bacterium]|nr:MAG: hypothetical protein UV95_C0002G0050 [Candidatus Falkowbacteria bacterium GW2011_GWF2_43_32]HBA36878.1 hypothetical protein [Candidatus Falkowbacteria bacterium]